MGHSKKRKREKRETKLIQLLDKLIQLLDKLIQPLDNLIAITLTNMPISKPNTQYIGI